MAGLDIAPDEGGEKVAVAPEFVEFEGLPAAAGLDDGPVARRGRGLVQRLAVGGRCDRFRQRVMKNNGGSVR